MKVDHATKLEWPEVYTQTPGEHPFMCKGVVGEWRNHFTPQQNTKFNAIYAEKIKVSGLKFEHNS